MRFRVGIAGALCLVGGQAVWARPVPAIARAVIPPDALQIISIDYAALRKSAVAVAFEQQLLFESLQGIDRELGQRGIDPDRDVTHMLIAVCSDTDGARLVAVVEGTFQTERYPRAVAVGTVAPFQPRAAESYGARAQTTLAVLDEHTVAFVVGGASNRGRRVWDGGSTQRDDAWRQHDVMMSGATAAPVWSVLNQAGTVNMLTSLVGGVAEELDGAIRSQILGSRYTIDPTDGLALDLDLVASGPGAAAALSWLLRATAGAMMLGSTSADARLLGNITIDVEQSTVHVRWSDYPDVIADLRQSKLLSSLPR